MAVQNVSSPTEGTQEEIPFLQKISAAIFVPTEQDFTSPAPTATQHPIARVERTIAVLEQHKERVEQQMLWMFTREAERIRRNGSIAKSYYDTHDQVITTPPATRDHELDLEERILSESAWEIDQIFNRDRDGTSSTSSRNGTEHYRPRDNLPPKRREFIPPRSLLISEQVQESHEAPRVVASKWVYNEINWSWEVLEGHSQAVRDETAARRARLQLQMQGNFLPANNARPVPSDLSAKEMKLPRFPSDSKDRRGSVASMGSRDRMDLD
ncbi:hypothetical protein F5Y18DRAFT_344235 [Xylariaceae sp. FL1019]|nr:hypothetical protein F5Y18DRAFT_344235 [Xylariaceae sp. FL1019]